MKKGKINIKKAKLICHTKIPRLVFFSARDIQDPCCHDADLIFRSRAFRSLFNYHVETQPAVES